MLRFNLHLHGSWDEENDGKRFRGSFKALGEKWWQLHDENEELWYTTTTTTMTTTTTRTRTRRTSNKQQTPTYFAKRQKTNPASSLPSLPRTQHFAADSDHMTFCTWQFRCNTTWPWPFHEEIGGNCMKLCHSGSEQFKMFRIWDK